MALRRRGSMHIGILIGVMMLALPLGGCDTGPEQQSSTEQPQLSYEQSTKLSAYARALLDFDPRRLKREFEERGIDRATAKDTPFIDAQSAENGWEDIRRARAMDGVLDGIDPLADRLLEPLGKLSARAKGLRSYLTMRGYLTDDFARARQETPAMIADYDATIAASDRLEKAVESARLKVEDELMRRLQSEGRMADYHELQIARHARTLRKLADTRPTPDPAALDEMEKTVTLVVPLLEQARTARAAENRKAGADAALDNGVIASAESMVGAFREYRRSKEIDDLNEFREAASNVLRTTA